MPGESKPLVRLVETLVMGQNKAPQQGMYTVYMYSIYVQYICTVYMYSIYVQYIGTVYTYVCI